jgi:hypothetical protein
MNKNTKILMLILLVLSIGFYLVSKKPWRTASKDAKAFSIEDTSVVTKIFMANKLGQKVLLERNAQNQWFVNGGVLAEESKVNLLLSTLHDMEIQKPLPPNMHNTAIGILAVRGIKTEIYSQDKLLKTIYVGSETPDQTGTFMLIEGEDEPYSIHVPGFIGYLTPRFFLSEIKWRSKLIFDVPAESIAEIQIDYPQNPASSFTFSKELFQSKGSVLNQKGEEFLADTQEVKMLLHSFEQKYAEGYYDDSTFTAHERDSLFQLTPYCTIRLKQVSGKEQHLAFYYKPIGNNTKERYDDNGNELSIDPEKFYVKLDNIEQIASVQEYAFRRILVQANRLKAKRN